jgi:sec-independent protein translocase protein TatB
MESFFGIGLPELFVIAILALIILGPERLPGAIREVAKVFRYVRNLTTELSSQFGEEFKALEDLNPQKLLRELTEDPEETAKAKGTTAAAAKSAAAAKPAAAKPATHKPATPKPAAKPATTTKTEKKTSVVEKPTEVERSTAVEDSTTASEAAGAPSEAKGDVEVENQILPPKLAESAAESADTATPAESAGTVSSNPSVDGAGGPPEVQHGSAPIRHPAFTVNGKSAEVEDEG